MNKAEFKLYNKFQEEYRGIVELTKAELSTMLLKKEMENVGWDNGVNFCYIHLRWKTCKGRFVPTDYTPDGHSTKLHQVIAHVIDAHKERDCEEINMPCARYGDYITKGDLNVE
jgi:hypothetical protein